MRKAPTPHGDVTYETVECDSCGNEVAKEEAYEFIIGDLSDIGTTTKVRHVQRKGWACSYCAGEGAIEFPTKSQKEEIVKLLELAVYDRELDMIDPFKLMAWVALLMVFVPVIAWVISLV